MRRRSDAMERTFILLKPDCVVRCLMGKLISRFEEKGLKVIGMKMLSPSRKQLEELYTQHREKPFYSDLIVDMQKAPVVAAVIEGRSAVDTVRKMCGITIGREAEPGTLRGDFSMSIRMNVIHAADSLAAAERELAIFFKPDEICRYDMPTAGYVYTKQELTEKEPEAPAKPRKTPGKED